MLLFPNSQPLSENLHGNTEIKKNNESYTLQKGITCFELRLFIYLFCVQNTQYFVLRLPGRINSQLYCC